MKINSKNWFVIYYKWIYDELPKDICTLFWCSLAIVITAVIVVPGRVANYLFHESGISGNIKTGISVYFLYFISIAVGMHLVISEEELTLRTFTSLDLFLWAPLAFCGLLLAIISAIVCIAFGVHLYQEYKEKKRREREQNEEEHPYIENTPAPGPSKLSMWVGAVRKKHCTKIEWVNEIDT